MCMESLVLSLIGVAIGVAVTIFASRYYYRRSIDKQLVPFLQYQSNVLDHIENDVKSDLDIEYKGVKVERLQQSQFLIANTGEKAIRDIIKPLRLDIHGEIEIMDVNLLHVHPAGREISINVDKESNTVEFNYPLLNKDEFFIVKLLVNGAPKKSDYKFSISAEDLPPILNIQRLSYQQIESEEKVKERVFEYELLLGGICILFFSFCIGLLSYYSRNATVPEIVNGTWSWLNVIPFLTIAQWTGYVLSLILGLISFMLMKGSFGDFEFPRRKKFVVPRDFTSLSWGHDFMTIEPNKAANKRKEMESGLDRLYENRE